MHIEFNSSPGPSLGVEVELELVDRQTGELVSAATDILTELGEGHPKDEHPKAKHELFECTIEIITGICGTVAEARADLSETLAEVRAAADRRGLDLMCSGTHPYSKWEDQEVSEDPRYHQLLEEMEWTAQRLQIFGVHFHVGVRHGERVVAIANALAGYIPHLLALSASSPYWEGRDTGLASSRSKVFEGLPTAGLPEQLDDWAEFEHFMETLVSAGAITTIREVWWDIRPHPDFGTVELRMCDGIPTLREVAALAALSQCLVTWLDQRSDGGRGAPAPVGLGPAPEQVAGRPPRPRRRPDRRRRGRDPTAGRDRRRAGRRPAPGRRAAGLCRRAGGRPRDPGGRPQRRSGSAAWSRTGGDLRAVVDHLVREMANERRSRSAGRIEARTAMSRRRRARNDERPPRPLPGGPR